MTFLRTLPSRGARIVALVVVTALLIFSARRLDLPRVATELTTLRSASIVMATVLLTTRKDQSPRG